MTVLLRAATPPTPPGSPVRPRRSRLLTLLVVLVTLVVCLANWETIGSALRATAQGHPGWMLLAGLGTVALWVAGTACQVGSLPITPPLGRLFLVQIAASFATRFTPAGIGGMAVNLRFLRKQNLSTTAGMTALGLNASVGALAHVLLLAAVVLVAPDGLAALAATGATGSGMYALGGLTGLLVVASLLGRRRLGRKGLSRRVRRSYADLRAVVVDPRRALALWGGALSGPLLHALTLYCAARSLDVDAPLAAVTTVYLAVSAVAALVPGPGGLGAFDVLLAAGLAGMGVPVASAVAVTVAYRLITVWLPLAPSGCVLAVLVRRGVL